MALLVAWLRRATHALPGSARYPSRPRKPPTKNPLPVTRFVVLRGEQRNVASTFALRHLAFGVRVKRPYQLRVGFSL
jgi:hypothetical protein